MDYFYFSSVITKAAGMIKRLSDVTHNSVCLVVDNCDYWLHRRYHNAECRNLVLNTLNSIELESDIPAYMEPVYVVGILSQLKQWAPTVPYTPEMENQLCSQIFDRLTLMSQSGQRLGMPVSPSKERKTAVHVLPAILTGIY
jgi:hypothetical protein